ncbi:MAG: FimV/HubP family polar landmark protein [Gammaproteobacteria bacterium]
MPRVRLAAVPLLAVLLPLTAAAVGLGEIKLQSALNQPFVAEIPVSVDGSEDPGQLSVQLAPVATFQRFGVDRPGFLDDLRFRVERDTGRTVIRVTSTKPVSEPLISLLLDVTWPQGRLLREYTVLLDPPAFRRSDSTAGTPQVATAAPAAAGPAPLPAPIRRDSAAVAPERSAPSPAPATGNVTTNASGQAAYGPVQANETLWRISERLLSEVGGIDAGTNLSVNQMMMALYRANPEAFAGNINRLHKGAVLRIPAGADLGAVSASQATAEVLRQDDAWRSGERTAGDGGTPPPARLQLVPPTESTAANRPGSTSAAGGEGTGTAAERAALERELAEKQRLLNLKDSQLKALQDRVSQLEGGQPAQAPVTDSATGAATDLGTPADTTDSGDLASAAGEQPPAVAAETAPVAKPATRPAADRAATRAPGSTGGQSDRGLLGTLMGLVFNIWFLVAAAVVLLVGTFVVFGRRRMEAADAASRQFDNDLRGGMSGSAAASTQPALRRDGYSVEEGAVDHVQDKADHGHDRTQATPAVGRVPRDPDAETPLERTISTEGAVELDQADVVAEAEFHMAYGLYDQAAELLTKALRESPGRRDLRLKLLEVYFIWENKEAFLKEAQAYKQQLKGADDPNWNKIVIMGKQICPGESLFAGAVAGGAGLDLTLADDGAGDPDVVDISFDEGDVENVDLDLTAARQGPSSDLLDFDLGSLDDDVESIEDTSVSRTMTAPGQTSEVPTIEAPGPEDYSPTRESPTLETPTVETPSGGSTLETPTLESAVPGYRQDSDQGDARKSAPADQTEEINLEDLGLDLTGLDEVADELGTGAHGSLDEGSAVEVNPDDAAADDDSDVFDIGIEDEDASDLLEGLEGDSTAEMRGMALDEGTFDLPEIGNAMDKLDDGRDTTSESGSESGQISPLDDTAEHKAASPDTLGDVSGELSAVDFDIGEDDGVELEPTAVMTGRRRGPDGPTMTEVGTKLDLARAYVDMGDPDGARSILNEVIEEGDSAQRQEARRLLDDLTG